jgi:hypothetical protein
MWSNVDTIKADVINAFHTRTIPLTLGPFSDESNTHVLGGVGAVPQASGLGCYKANLTDPQIAGNAAAPNAASRWTSALDSPLEYTTPGESVVGGDTVGTTVYAYLNQISGCALSGVINDLTQRCCEIQPVTAGVPTTTNTIINLLQHSPPLYMNTNLYICKSNPTDPTSPLVITATAPGTATPYFAGGTPPTPDGTNVAGAASDCNSGQYGLGGGGSGGLIDSKSLNMVNGADNNLHDQPFMNSGSIDATDHADFILSSGYQNELGKLDFYQTLSTNGGTDQFSRPN